MRPFLSLTVAALVLLAGCGNRDTSGPQGDPTAIVHGAAGHTVAAGRAQVAIAGPGGFHAEGSVNLATRQGRMLVGVPGQSDVAVDPGPPPTTLPEPVRRVEYTDPSAMLALLRSATKVDPYGGVQVRSVGTIRYDVTIDHGGTRFYANVYVDSEGRCRRIEVPEDRHEPRPSDRAPFLARIITIDFVSFGP
ncbi:MAG TPA: hypothetical protein VFA94_15670 [Acidimicrobiales bacterium]|nr:hypothetical protein [Acidimicrobiales bacterium]